MADPYTIIIPLINPNEPGALLAELHVVPGQYLVRGAKLCTLETTKSTQELSAEVDGYLVGLRHAVGDTIFAGEILGYLADSPDWTPPTTLGPNNQSSNLGSGDLRISQPALQLAQKHNLDLSQFSPDMFFTEKMVQEKINMLNSPALDLQGKHFEESSIIVYGGGGHGKALIDLIRTLATYSIVGIVDDGIPAGTTIMGTSVLGGASTLPELFRAGVHLAANAVGGIGNIAPRLGVFDNLKKAGFSFPTLVHPTAFVETSAALSDGVQVMPHAYVGSDARIGFGAIVNTGAIVSHDCVLGDFANLSPGAILAGEVTIGQASLVGMGATINLRVSVGAGVRIGNGVTVKRDVPDGSLVRAGTIWPE
jgi:acetyltransferase EpsM